MKLLENSAFYALASALSAETLDCRLETRLESYSCKLVGDEKRMWKELCGSPHEREALAPPQEDDFLAVNASPLSTKFASDPESSAEVVMCDSLSRKTLFYLTSTLNRCFPDYDFSDAKGENFSREPSVQHVIRAVDSKLRPVVENYEVLQMGLWAAIDQEMRLGECSVFSYSPDYASDPFSADGGLWSFNYFFYNKPLKRLVFLACRAWSKTAPVLPDEYKTQWSMEEP